MVLMHARSVRKQQVDAELGSPAILPVFKGRYLIIIYVYYVYVCQQVFRLEDGKIDLRVDTDNIYDDCSTGFQKFSA